MILTRAIIVFSFFTTHAHSFIAADLKFPVAAIPAVLTKDANLVYREDQLTFTIFSRSRAVERTYVAITILNEKGKNVAKRYVGYSNLVKVNSIEGAVYDSDGKLVRKLKNSQITDHSSSGSNLFDDNRYKMADLNHPTYPYTIEFESEIEYKYLFFIPSWQVVPGEQASVEHSKFTIIFVPEAMPRFKTYNTDKQPDVTHLPDGKQSAVWYYENIPAMQREPLGPALHESTPVIEVAPGFFEYDGYGGDMRDWNGFGKWISRLNRGRDVLPEETKMKVKELTQNKQSVEEKARALYQFLQDKTRYVSIQIGIGGYQPFEALTVDQTSYGDCKALSNYMVALLKEAGVKANYVLISAGDEKEDIDGEFPSTQFNHAIAAIPQANDTLWLECTSQTNPFGYSGTFTGDRHALMITDDGASIVATPTYPQHKNREQRMADVTLSNDGSALARVNTNYTGLQYEKDHLDYYLNQSAEEQKKWILENTDVPSFELKKFSMTETKDKLPQATVSLELFVKNFASVSGKRLFVNPNLMNRNTYVPKKVTERKTPVILKKGTIDEDVVSISFPEEFYPEFTPPLIHFESRFGVYDASFSLEAGKLKYSRKLKMNKGEFPPDSYNELIDFYKNVNKADNMKLVFLNKT